MGVHEFQTFSEIGGVQRENDKKNAYCKFILSS